MKTLLTLSLLLVGCGPAAVTRYAFLSSPPHRIQPHDPADVRLFTSGPPQQPYVEIGMIEVHPQNEFVHASTADMLSLLRREAGRRGCDGVIVSSHSDTGMSPMGWTQVSLEGFRGACVVYQ